jgi:cytosine/adenosine deaminase-related metal-dependent hydrolase
MPDGRAELFALPHNRCRSRKGRLGLPSGSNEKEGPFMNDMILSPKYLWDGVSGQVSEHQAILVQNGVVRKIGAKETLQALCPEAEIRENENWLAMPAFVDAHDHGRGITPSSMSVPDRALEIWLQDLNKLAAIPHYDACYYDGILLASSGVGTVLHSHNPNDFFHMKEELVQAARGYRDAGLRSILCPLFIDQNKRIYYNRDEFIAGLPEPLRSTFAAGIRDQLMTMDDYLTLMEETREALRDEIDAGWVELQLHPNGGQWCSDKALLRMKEYAMEHHMHIHLHLLETQYQAEYARRTWGKSFIKHYSDIGFLGPWVSFGHAVWLDEEDLRLIAESGAILVNLASSNLRLRSGAFQMHRAAELNLTCGIGLDGCTLDDDQDYLREIRVAWLNNRRSGVDAVVDYRYPLNMATSMGAQIAAGRLSEGVIAEGRNADFVCLNMETVCRPYADPGSDPLAMVVQRATRSSVEMTFVNGVQTWGVEESFRRKAADAGTRIAQVLRELRAADPGKRDNALLLAHVHDFYAE